MKERDILHLTIPAFGIALARVIDPGLRQRPVVIAPGVSERSLLQCVSREAANEGIQEGMSLRQARCFCPGLTVLPPDPQLLSRGQRALLQIVSNYSPVIEPHPGGRIFLDLTGSRRLFGPGRDVATRLEKEIDKSLRLYGSVGVAGNKLVSRIASGYLEHPGVCDVLRGSERCFIAPLPVSMLPGIGPTRGRLLLQELNLQKVADLAALKLPQLRLVLGSFAALAHQRAQGIDPSLVCPPKRTPEVAEESFLSHTSNDDTVLLAELCRLVESCGQQLRRLQRGTTELTLTIHYADGVQQSRAARLSEPQDHDFILFAHGEKLFNAICTRRTRVKGLKLSCGKLRLPGCQGDLFAADGPSPRQQALQQTIDQLRGRYGMQSIQRGRTLVA
jgi:DNA polymerase IV